MSSLLVIFVWGGEAILYAESGQKQSVKLLQNMVYSTIQHSPPTPPPSHILSVYTVHFSLCTPRLCWGGGHTRRAERGMGGQYFEDERDRIALLQ